MANYSPVGWTPIGLSLERAGADFPAASETVANAIILVTDGLETCDGDPCAIATALKQSEAAVTVYVVGLGLDEEELRITSCIAENTGGQIVGAQNADELSAALFTFLEELEVVVTTGFLEIESIGGLYPLATLTCAEQEATDRNPQGGEPFTYTFTHDTNKVEVPVGVCDLAWTNPSGKETAIQVNIEADRTTFVRGSLLKFPQGAGEIYVLKAQDGTVIWQDQIEQGDWVWVLPGIYTLRPARTRRRPDPDLVHRTDPARLRDPGRDLHRAIANAPPNRRQSGELGNPSYDPRDHETASAAATRRSWAATRTLRPAASFTTPEHPQDDADNPAPPRPLRRRGSSGWTCSAWGDGVSVSVQRRSGGPAEYEQGGVILDTRRSDELCHDGLAHLFWVPGEERRTQPIQPDVDHLGTALDQAVGETPDGGSGDEVSHCVDVVAGQV